MIDQSHEHSDEQRSRRIIPVKKASIGGPGSTRPRQVQARKASDYPHVPAPYLETARRYANPLLFGPPLCDELVAFIQHVYTEEEATLVQHIKTPLGKTAGTLAAAVQRPVDEVRPILERLCSEKPVFLTTGQGSSKRYGLLPIVPGLFESIMVRTSLDSLTDWHRRFAELFEALFETGYLLDYAEHPMATVRYMPVQGALQQRQHVLPFDKLEEILEPYSSFAVGMCQCRMTEQIVGRGCDAPMETCLGFGDIVNHLVDSGRMRRVDKQEALEIKAQAEQAGLVNFTSDLLQGRLGGSSCSCCSCCCHALRTVTEFNMPGLIAPPHFRPQLDETQCLYCGKCARACPMGAIIVEPKAKTYQYLPERCIGCGLCAVACDKKHAITMLAEPNYQPPPGSMLAALWQVLPNYLRNVWATWRKYQR